MNIIEIQVNQPWIKVVLVWTFFWSFPKLIPKTATGRRLMRALSKWRTSESHKPFHSWRYSPTKHVADALFLLFFAFFWNPLDTDATLHYNVSHDAFWERSERSEGVIYTGTAATFSLTALLCRIRATGPRPTRLCFVRLWVFTASEGIPRFHLIDRFPWRDLINILKYCTENNDDSMN